MKKLILLFTILLFLSAFSGCEKAESESTEWMIYEGEQTEEERLAEEEAFKKSIEQENQITREKREREDPIKIVDLGNGIQKYLGKSDVHNPLPYSIEFDPNIWEVTRDLLKGDAWLRNKLDEDCSMILAPWPKGFEGCSAEDLEGGITKVCNAIYYYSTIKPKEASVTIEMYLKDPSKEDFCLPQFREIAKTLKFE